jgi:transcriptional regulator with XRE-family HTH domain
MHPLEATSETFEAAGQSLSQLGSRLKSARVAQGISALQLAKRLAISRTTLRAVERGSPSPSLGTFIAVVSSGGLAARVLLQVESEDDVAEPQSLAPNAEINCGKHPHFPRSCRKAGSSA